MKTYIILPFAVILLLMSGRQSEKIPGPPQNNIRNSSTIQKKRELLQRIYSKEIGVRESRGRNDGDRVEEYLRAVKLHRGEPWCAAFICWVFDRALIKNPQSGWAANLFPNKKIIWQRSEDLYARDYAAIAKEPPHRADVFGIWFPEKGRIAHAGFVDHWDGGWLITVEGNTNEALSREGDGVYRKRRLQRTIYAVSSWVK